MKVFSTQIPELGGGKPSASQSSLLSNMTSSESKSSFRKVQKFSTDWSAEVITQYESRRSGMQAVIVDHKGPKVNGYFALATEIHDDSGAREYQNLDILSCNLLMLS